MIDIHSHIIPYIDDGAKTLEDAIKMLQIAEQEGTKKIIATSHYYKSRYENKYEDMLSHVVELNKKSKERGLNIEIFPGQEVFLDKDILTLYDEGIIKGLNNSKYMLIEMSMKTMPKDALDLIYELRIKGITPIIAHPERYSYIIDKPSLINDFVDENCLFQINSGSLTGIFGKSVQKTSKILIENNVCDFIASDAHSTGKRCPSVNLAIQMANDINKNIKLKVQENGEKILKNEDIISTFSKIKEKKSIFSFLKIG